MLAARPALLLLLLLAAAACRAAAPVKGTLRGGDSAPHYSWAEPRPEVEGWMQQHQLYVSEAEQARQSGDGFQLLFYGDSITECWRGTGIGKPSPQNCAGTPEVYARRWAAHYRCDVFAVGADKTSHLMWRLLHGEGPQGLRTRAAFVLIGTNDLGYAAAGGPAAILAVANSTAAHARAIAGYLLGADPTLQVVLQGLLPRGDWDFPPPQKYSQPSKYTHAIDAINAELAAWAARQPRVHFVYCGGAYLDKSGASTTAAGGGDSSSGTIRGDLMPDGLHPNARGMELLADCLVPWAEHLTAALATGGAAAEGEEAGGSRGAEEGERESAVPLTS